jgi:hypothetical protein
MKRPEDLYRSVEDMVPDVEMRAMVDEYAGNRWPGSFLTLDPAASWGGGYGLWEFSPNRAASKSPGFNTLEELLEEIRSEVLKKRAAKAKSNNNLASQQTSGFEQLPA